jgi:hypothetical protein
MLKLAVLISCLALGFCSPLSLLAKNDRSILCGKCKDLVTQYITDANIQKVLDQGSKACDSLPAQLSAKCKSLVSQYGPEVAAEILSNKDQLCVMAHLCPGTSLARTSLAAGSLQAFQQVIKVTPMDCSGCKLGIDLLKTILDSSLMSSDVETLFANAVCTQTDPAQQTQCMLVISTVYSTLISTVEGIVSCKNVCQTAIAGCRCS